MPVARGFMGQERWGRVEDHDLDTLVADGAGDLPCDIHLIGRRDPDLRSPAPLLQENADVDVAVTAGPPLRVRSVKIRRQNLRPATEDTPEGRGVELVSCRSLALCERRGTPGPVSNFGVCPSSARASMPTCGDC